MEEMIQNQLLETFREYPHEFHGNDIIFQIDKCTVVVESSGFGNKFFKVIIINDYTCIEFNLFRFYAKERETILDMVEYITTVDKSSDMRLSRIISLCKKYHIIVLGFQVDGLVINTFNLQICILEDFIMQQNGSIELKDDSLDAVMIVNNRRVYVTYVHGTYAYIQISDDHSETTFRRNILISTIVDYEAIISRIKYMMECGFFEDSQRYPRISAEEYNKIRNRFEYIDRNHASQTKG